MAFKALFLAHAPDAVPEQQRADIATSLYQLFVRVVRNQEQALAACRQLVDEEEIHAVLLCPGFTHKDIAELAEAAGPKVGVFVARGDSPSNAVVAEVMAKEGWFAH